MTISKSQANTRTVDPITGDAANIGTKQDGVTNGLHVISEIQNSGTPIEVSVVGLNEIKEKLTVTDGSPSLPDLSFIPQSGTEVKVFYNGMLMDEGSGDDYQISGKTITFEYNLVNQAPRYGKVTVYYVKSLV